MKYYELAIKSLHQRLEQLEKRVEYLEDENISLSNELYEVQNRLDMLSRYSYNMEDFSLGDFR